MARTPNPLRRDLHGLSLTARPAPVHPATRWAIGAGVLAALAIILTGAGLRTTQRVVMVEEVATPAVDALPPPSRRLPPPVVEPPAAPALACGCDAPEGLREALDGGLDRYVRTRGVALEHGAPLAPLPDHALDLFWSGYDRLRITAASTHGQVPGVRPTPTHARRAEREFAALRRAYEVHVEGNHAHPLHLPQTDRDAYDPPPLIVARPPASQPGLVVAHERPPEPRRTTVVEWADELLVSGLLFLSILLVAAAAFRWRQRAIHLAIRADGVVVEGTHVPRGEVSRLRVSDRRLLVEDRLGRQLWSRQVAEDDVFALFELTAAWRVERRREPVEAAPAGDHRDVPKELRQVLVRNVEKP